MQNELERLRLYAQQLEDRHHDMQGQLARKALELSRLEEKLRDIDLLRWPKQKHAQRHEDMGDGLLTVDLDSDNDVIVTVYRKGKAGLSVEFCNGMGGGGKSPKTRAALINLMSAMEADAALDNQ